MPKNNKVIKLETSERPQIIFSFDNIILEKMLRQKDQQRKSPDKSVKLLFFSLILIILVIGMHAVDMLYFHLIITSKYKNMIFAISETAVIIGIIGIIMSIILARKNIRINPDLKDILLIEKLLMVNDKFDGKMMVILDYTQNIIRIQYLNKVGQYRCLKFGYDLEVHKACKDIEINISKDVTVIIPTYVVSGIEKNNLDGKVLKIKSRITEESRNFLS